jgi:hypothetical protein
VYIYDNTSHYCLNIEIFIDGFGEKFKTNILYSVSFAELHWCDTKAWKSNEVPD